VDRALLELLYATGARISEAVDPTTGRRDVIGTDRASIAAPVRQGEWSSASCRSGPMRRLPSTHTGAGAAAAFDQGKADPALFLGIRGQRVSRQNAWLIIRARAEQRGSDSRSHHTRHPFRTHLPPEGRMRGEGNRAKFAHEKRRSAPQMRKHQTQS
jgi:integrase/recombinase XerD